VLGADERRELSEEIEDKSSRVKSPCVASCWKHRANFVAGC